MLGEEEAQVAVGASLALNFTAFNLSVSRGMTRVESLIAFEAVVPQRI